MSRYKSPDMIAAYEAGGFRERFAMEYGNKTTILVRGHKCFKFTYSKWKEYQDANGAIYDTVIKNWIS